MIHTAVISCFTVGSNAKKSCCTCCGCFEVLQPDVNHRPLNTCTLQHHTIAHCAIKAFCFHVASGHLQKQAESTGITRYYIEKEQNSTKFYV